jgi:hypothetical protein
MLDDQYYLKLIDFGEAMVVDHYQEMPVDSKEETKKSFAGYSQNSSDFF